MNSQVAISPRAYPVRDAAVDGLLRGFLAGGAMLLYLVIAALTYSAISFTDSCWAI